MTQVQPFVISTCADEAAFFEWATGKLAARKELKQAHIQKEALEYELTALNGKIAQLTSDALVVFSRVESDPTPPPERQGIQHEPAGPENYEQPAGQTQEAQ